MDHQRLDFVIAELKVIFDTADREPSQTATQNVRRVLNMGKISAAVDILQKVRASDFFSTDPSGSQQ
jgi:hypothetical protein